MTDDIPTPITDAGFDAICNNTPPNQRILAVLGMAKKLERERHELREACREALLVLATLKITDDEKPYREIAPLLRSAIRRAHDAAFAILAATDPKK